MEYLVMCIGNREGGDDAIGAYIADLLKKKEQDIAVLDCGTVPENYISVVKQHKPKNLIIIDAVEMGLNPGEMRIVPKEKIGKMHISTHGIPISVLMNYLETFVKRIFLIGIQPEKMSGEISENILESGKKLIELIKNNKIKQIESLS
jgi:hydrogenase 3 maturation protease